VLELANRSSSFAVSLSLVAELIESCIDALATNGVRWDTRSVLAAALSYFLKLVAKLELLGLGGYPLDPGAPGLELADIVRPAVHFPHTS
jgi:hypothetical protein